MCVFLYTCVFSIHVEWIFIWLCISTCGRSLDAFHTLHVSIFFFPTIYLYVSHLTPWIYIHYIYIYHTLFNKAFCLLMCNAHDMGVNMSQLYHPQCTHVHFTCIHKVWCIRIGCSVCTALIPTLFHQVWKWYMIKWLYTLNSTKYNLWLLSGMGWLRLVGAIKLDVSLAEYSLFYRALLQKRPII